MDTIKHKGEICTCQFCGKQYKLYGIKNHEKYCKSNPDRKEYIMTESQKKNFGGYWKKGLTAETDDRVRRSVETLKQRYKNGELTPHFTGKHWSEEHKKHISETLRKYYLDHPDEVGYKLHHSSKISYPEQYFMDLFKLEKINLKYHLQIGLYELDFYNEDKKIYVEIDGGTHDQPKVQQIDNRKDKYLSNLGWKGIRIKWDEYKKKDLDGRKKVINDIKLLVL